MVATSQPDILRVTETVEASAPPLDAMLQTLERAVGAGDRLTTEATLAQTIPSFVPNLPRPDMLSNVTPRP